MQHLHVSREHFLVYLAQGWCLPFVVQPSMGHHGRYSVTLWRPVE